MDGHERNVNVLHHTPTIWWRHCHQKRAQQGKGEVSSSRCVVDYNKYMDRVDLSHQLLQYYSVHKTDGTGHFCTTSVILLQPTATFCTKRCVRHQTLCQFMEELSAELCGVPKGSDVPPRAPQCLPESLACVDEDDDGGEEEEEEGSSSFERLRSADTAKKGLWLLPGRVILFSSIPALSNLFLTVGLQYLTFLSSG